MRHARRIILSAIIIAFITAVAFIPCLFNGFVWDDAAYIVGNPAVRNLSWPGVKHLFTSTFVASYVPLTMLSFTVEYHFFGLNPFPYHLTNLLLHILNSILVFLFIHALTDSVIARSASQRRSNPMDSRPCLLSAGACLLTSAGMTKKDCRVANYAPRNDTQMKSRLEQARTHIAFITAILFAIHPLRVESVAWISERKDVLYAMFFLAALISWLRMRNTGRRTWYYAALGLFLCSLFSKPTAVSFPLALLCCEYFRKGKIDRTVFSETIPFFVLATVFAAATLLSQAEALRHGAPFWMGILTAARGLIFYLEKTFAPVDLSALYFLPPSEHIPPSFMVAPFILAGITALVFFSRRYTRVVIFGSLFFLATILPALQVVPFGSSIAADRHTYLPSIGLAYIAAVEIVFMMEKKWKYGRAIKAAVAGLLILSVIMLTSLTRQRCRVWKSDLTLWTDVVEKHPWSSVALYNRGSVYCSLGDYAKAIPDFTRAVELNPKLWQAYYNRAVAYRGLKQYDRALEDAQSGKIRK